MKGPWKLVYSESFDSRSQAMLREKHVKSSNPSETEHMRKFLPDFL
jgi:predicted GIY-YIG superfamily endonuclease